MENLLLDSCIENLLHINEPRKNKLINIFGGDLSKTIMLSREGRAHVGSIALETVRERRGKPGNTALRGSSMGGNQYIGQDLNLFDWQDAEGVRDAKKLNAFVTAVQKETRLKGNNPLYFCVGALRWKIPLTAGSNEASEVATPLLIFPMQLNRQGDGATIMINFVDDDAYFNPCLKAKLAEVLGKEVADNFPHPNGMGQFDAPLDLARLGNGEEYFERVKDYVFNCRKADTDGETVFHFEPDTVAIVQYSHGDLCMYYDIKRNYETIANHPLVNRLFTEDVPLENPTSNREPTLVLSADTYQKNMIKRVVNGESLIVKGPPGTGKTQTIANMIAALLCEGKKVLLASKKLAALAEVRAKLPEPLRKFVLLLDNVETEEQTAEMDTSPLRQEFRVILKQREQYKPPVLSDVNLNKEMTSAFTFLRNYKQGYMFGSDNKISVFSGSYYDGIDVYCKNNCQEVPFAPMETVLLLTHDEYDQLWRRCGDASAHYMAMTSNEKHLLSHCPWRGVHALVNNSEKAHTLDDAIVEYASISQIAKTVLADGNRVLTNGMEVCQDIPISYLVTIARTPFSNEAVKGIFDCDRKDLFDEITKRRKIYNTVTHYPVDFVDDQAIKVIRSLESTFPFVRDDTLTFEQSILLADHGDILKKDNALLGQKELESVVNFIEQIGAIALKKQEHLNNARKVFTVQACQNDKDDLEKSCEALAKYELDATKPGMLDFKGKKAFETLKKLTYLPNVTFGDCVQAAHEYNAYLAEDNNIAFTTQLLAQQFGRVLSAEEVKCLQLLVDRCKLTKQKPADYLQNHLRVHQTISKLVEVLSYNCQTIGELVDCAKFLLTRDNFANSVKALQEVIGAELPIAPDKIVETAKKIAILKVMQEDKEFGVLPTKVKCEFIDRVHKADSQYINNIESLFDSLANFKEKYFENFYSNRANVTYRSLEVFAVQAVDKNILSSSLEYAKAIVPTVGVAGINLVGFFAHFEQGAKTQGYSMQDIFEHSAYALALEAYRKYVLKTDRYGLGDKVESNCNSYRKCLQASAEYNVGKVEQICMSKINPQDQIFAPLNTGRVNHEVMRLLFKKYPQMIMAIKPCMIISPSTASVLFRNKEYENFDVVIVDEASQLEPVNMLPMLYRSKQCVIVGDEWQMPPIKHFVSTTEKVVVSNDNEVTVMDPDDSALAMALRNRSFRTEELICHYRSKTEALITFSQGKFYPNMRTFPAPRPIDKEQGLGFVDVYVPDGRCAGGVNDAEAKKVVDLIALHFQKYYDDQTGVLSRSLGIVAFGGDQIKRIIKLVEANKMLYDCIETAKNNFADPIKDKLIFYRTIETVQGQEADDLILSITYGRDKDGDIVQSFGQLNRGKLGQCIFNVAVTRAKSSISVVHSVKSTDISDTNENISYIREYLSVVERYAQAGKDQFVSEVPGKGFLRSVGEFIASCGIAENRIVYNYGVTKGSVRIPIAILTKDLQEAQLGIFCEVDVAKKYNFIDYNVLYKDILQSRGWTTTTVNAHDWVDNATSTREKLQKVIRDM